MRALRPAALELSLQTADDLKKERQRLDQDWRQRLERCRYEADRAQRQYRAVEPENRAALSRVAEYPRVVPLLVSPAILGPTARLGRG
jgi:hypothetical protein